MNDHHSSGPNIVSAALESDPISGLPPVYTALTANALSALTEELLHRLNDRLTPDTDPTARVTEPPDDEEIDDFARALILPEAETSRLMFMGLRDAGKTPDTLSLDYVATAARRLGEWWSADRCSFLDATIGSARLHILQHSLRGEFTAIGQPRPVRQSAFFAPVPGESHGLGVSIAADFFHRAGWYVDLSTPETVDALCARVCDDHYDLIGLSAACTAVTDSVEQSVRCIRAVRPDARIVLGGYLTELEPGLARSLEIEEVPADIASAPFLLENPSPAAINH